MRPPGGMGQKAGELCVPEPAEDRSGKVFFDADGNHVHPAGTVRAGVSQQARLGSAERHRQVGGQHRPGHLARVCVDAAGQVAGHHESVTAGSVARLKDGLNQRGSSPPQSTFGARAQDGINDDAGTPVSAASAASASSVSSSARPPARSKAASAAGCAAPPVRTAVVRIPREARKAAAYRPSPPLLPLPASTTTRVP